MSGAQAVRCHTCIFLCIGIVVLTMKVHLRDLLLQSTGSSQGVGELKISSVLQHGQSESLNSVETVSPLLVGVPQGVGQLQTGGVLL